MKFRRILCLILALCTLTGCSLLSDTYVSVTPHQEQNQKTQDGMIQASDYRQLRSALEDMVFSARESAIIDVTGYESKALESGMSMAARYIETAFPIGAYAVDALTYEIGITSGKNAVAVNIVYNRSRIEIRKIRTVADMEATAEAMYESLEDHDATLVLLVENYAETDFPQLAKDYAEAHPEGVMETPAVSIGVYGGGNSRVMEFTFAYENSRENLRQMKSQVAPVFASAALYVSGDSSDAQKFSQLYAFLMERFDYTLETSITPAYSLLCYGVGDTRAFATVYAAMCRRAGLECLSVTGTAFGEPRTWNIICDNGTYYHIDLLRCSQEGRFRGCGDWEMGGYVWNYSEFPACGSTMDIPEESTEDTEPTE